MTRLTGLVIVTALSLVCSGCAVYMAATQPDEKNLSLFRKGEPRANLIAEFGSPTHTEFRGSQRVDIFTFVQGYHGAVKAGRAIAHGAADVFTLGLWEAVGTPVEGHFNGTKISAEVTYDAQDQVVDVRPLRGENEIAESTIQKPQASTGQIETSSTY